MTFWVITAILSLAGTGLILRPMLRGSNADTNKTDAEYGLAVYRDQLAEVDRDLAKGVLNEDEAARTRLEISRRILDADKDFAADSVERTTSRAVGQGAVILSVCVLMAGTFGVYQFIGAGGAPDFPLQKRLAAIDTLRESRPSQAKAEAEVGTLPTPDATPEYIQLVEQLREKAGARPDDLKGQQLLAQHEARIGNFIGARIAQGRVVDILGDAATGADYVDLAELMIIAANGFVSPQAEQALGRAIQLAPADSRARYYAGLGLSQTGRPDITYKLWNQLLNEGPEDAPWIAPIRSEIESVARQAGLSLADIPQPTTTPGPTSEDIRDAENLSDSERQEFIRAMVSRLSERLATEGGNAQEWARLIRALGVLGETARASAIWKEAKDTFGADPIAMETLLEAARTAEIAN